VGRMTEPIGPARPSSGTNHGGARLLTGGLAVVVVLAAFAAVRVAGGGCAPFAGTPCVRVLFIGNSYTYVNDLPRVFGEIARSGGQNVETAMVAHGGETLAEHAASPETLGAISGSSWHFVVLQEQSEIPSVEALRQGQMYPAAQSLAGAIRAAGGNPVLLETWAHRDGWPDYSLSYTAMQAQIDHGYLQLAGDLGVGVATVGDAWQVALDQTPALALWQADGSHPTMEGTYLAACVLYGRLFNASPVGIAESEGLSPEIVHQLQVVAAQTN